MKNIFFACALLLGLSISASGQRVFNLESCIELALEKNIQLQQTALNVDRAKYNKERAVADLLPTLNAGASTGYNYGRRIDPFTNQFAADWVQSSNLFAGANLTLFSGLTKIHNMKQSRYTWLATQMDVAGAQNSLRMNVTTAYMNILFAEELVGIAANQVEGSKLQVERTQKLVEAGQLARASLYDIESQMASEELNLVNAQNDLLLAKVNLILLLQIEGYAPEEFEIESPELGGIMTTPLATNAEEIYNAALQLMPEITAAEYRMESSRLGLAAAKGLNSPTLSLSGQIGTGYSGLNFNQNRINVGQLQIGEVAGTGEAVITSNDQFFFENTGVKSYGTQFSDNLNRNISINLNIPIFNGWQTRTAVKQARIDFESARLGLDATKNTLFQDIQRAHTDAVAAYNQYLSSSKAVLALEENFKYAEVRFEEKAINAVEFFDIKFRLANAQSNLVQAKYSYLFRTKILDFYQGKPITL
jgi:outer membrane protein